MEVVNAISSHTADAAHVLVMDDDPTAGQLIALALECAGYFFEVVLCGRDGLAAVDRQRPDLILLDVSMPDIDGFEVCRRLKLQEKSRNIPIIFLTSDSGSESIIKGIELGAVDYVTKPFNTAELMARVRTHTELKRSRDIILEINERLTREIEERTRAEAALREERDHSMHILHSLPALVCSIAPNGVITYVNPTAERIIRRGAAEIVGEMWWHVLYPAAGPDQLREITEKFRASGVRDYHMVMVTPTGEERSIYWSTVNRYDGQGALSEIIAFGNDLTEVDQFIKKQEINIDLAKGILDLVNAPPLRYADLPGGRALFIETLSVACNAEGGDHFFVRTFAQDTASALGKTFVSLKDQSGHEVGCVLRSIVTDLIHNALLHTSPLAPLDELLTRLNHDLCETGLFESDDFLTAFDLVIDHDSLEMAYVCTGHPPLVLLREGKALHLPEWESDGANLPLTVDDSLVCRMGRFALRVGDRIVLYTDGLTEMPQRRGARIGIEALKEKIARQEQRQPGAPVSSLVRALLADIADMSGEEVVPYGPNTSADDVTLLGIEIEPPQAGEASRWRAGEGQELHDWIGGLAERIGGECQVAGVDQAGERVRLVLEEGILNAWRHGNQQRPGSRITVRWYAANDIHLEILDEGAGFEYWNPSDPCSTLNRTKESGRGIFLMRLAADYLRWRDGGRCCVASFRRHPAPAAVRKRGVNRKHVPLWYWQPK
jgi:PAS domain S-box-containing protein